MFPALGIYLVECNGCKEFENAWRTNSMGSSKTIETEEKNTLFKTESMVLKDGVCVCSIPLCARKR